MGRRAGCGGDRAGFPAWRAFGTIYRGWVKAKNGDVAEGISLLRSGSAAYRATGAELLMPHHIALLARACDIAGQIEEAVTAVGRCSADRGKDRGALAGRGALSAQRPVAAAARAFRGRRGTVSQSPEHRRRSRRPSSGNCAPPRASPGSAATRAAAPKPATSSHRSTAGSPKALTRPILKKQRRCSRCWMGSRMRAFGPRNFASGGPV